MSTESEKTKQEQRELLERRFSIPKIISAEWIREMKTGNAEIADSFRIWGFSYRDLSECTITADVALLKKIPFDTTTVFPTKLPDGYNPKEIIARAMVPCLGLEQLHRDGCSGEGMHVAVIDMNMKVIPREIAGNIEYIQEAMNPGSNFHGCVVSSLLAGEHVGIAPRAVLHFYSHSEEYPACVAEQLNSFALIIQRIKNGEAIKVVNCSWSYRIEDKEKFLPLYEELKKLGCEVIDSRKFAESFTCGNFNGDTNDVENVGLSDWQGESQYAGMFDGKVVVPAGGRMIPLYGTETEYMYCPQSSYSWAIPMLTGIYVLALQAKPTLQYEEFVEVAKNTAKKNSKGLLVINPRGIIEAVKENK